MKDDPKFGNWFGQVIDPPGPATWISRPWRKLIAGILTCLLNPKITIKWLASDGVSTLTKDADIIMGPRGWTAVVSLQDAVFGSGGGSLEVTDGTNTVLGVTEMIFTGATVGGISSACTVTCGPELTDGTTDLKNVSKITVSGMTVGGTATNATLSVNGIAVFTFVSDGGDYLVCTPYGGGSNVNIAKHPKLRTSLASEVIRGITYTYTYTAVTHDNGTGIGVTAYYTRAVSGSDGSSETDLAIPDILSGNLIFAFATPNTGVAGVTWQEISPRCWTSV